MTAWPGLVVKPAWHSWRLRLARGDWRMQPAQESLRKADMERLEVENTPDCLLILQNILSDPSDPSCAGKSRCRVPFPNRRPANSRMAQRVSTHKEWQEI
ncbi:hypothetical protein MHYP_G00017880 [Metynnis hypsauchen]